MFVEEVTRLQDECNSLKEVAEQQKKLVANLEDDLMRVNSLQRTEAEGADDPDPHPRESDVVSKAIHDVSSAFKNSNTADSLLPIIASQRERFRQRVVEVEEQNMQYQQHMVLLQTEVDKMRSDNVKLYEKIKFLQSYKGRSSKSAVTGDDTVARYSSQYEDTLDPFRNFSMQERSRKYLALKTHDKATLGIGRFIMRSSRARAVFFFYLLFLHLLIFAVLYKLAFTQSCRREVASDCAERFKEHMQLVHGEHQHAD